jgi:hypothetical protein
MHYKKNFKGEIIVHYSCSGEIKISQILKNNRMYFDDEVKLQISCEKGIDVTFIDDLVLLGIRKVSLFIKLKLRSRMKIVFCDIDSEGIKSREIFRSYNIFLYGKESASDVVIRAGGIKTRYIFHVEQHHGACKTTSYSSVKSVLDEASQLFCRGTIQVDENALGSVATLENRNILLDESAKVTSLPVLKIETDDTQCSHKVATGTLCKDQLFYLQSRGYSLCEAKKALIDTFLSFQTTH